MYMPKPILVTYLGKHTGVASYTHFGHRIVGTDSERDQDMNSLGKPLGNPPAFQTHWESKQRQQPERFSSLW